MIGAIGSTPLPMRNTTVQPGDEVDLNALGSNSQQSAAQAAVGGQSPLVQTGTPGAATGGYGSALSAWNTSVQQTGHSLRANPLHDIHARIALGQRLSDPETIGVHA